MRCKNCGKKIKAKQAFCPHCGSPVEIEEKNNEVALPKKKAQVGRIILIVLLVIMAMASLMVLILTTSMDVQATLDSMFQNEAWLVLNIVTVFLPALIIIMIGVLGWIAIAAIDVLGVIIALLTMIKASKTKKIILLVLIVCFIAMGLVAFFTRQPV